MISKILAAITAVGLAIVWIFKTRPTNKDKLREQIDELEEQIEKKRQAMLDALDSGYDDHANIIRVKWLQLCRKRNNLYSRLKKD